MPIAPLLQRFVEDELALAPALVSRVVAGTVRLLGPANDAASGAERMDHADVMASLRQRSSQYESAFVESLKKQVGEDLVRRTDPSCEEPASELDSLELMDESRVEVDIEISRAMQLIDSTAEWELRELQMFTSTLVGQTHVTAESNPFRPLVYATALWDAACVVADSQSHRALILRTSAGVAAGLLKNASAAASSRLEAQGVEPGVYRTVVLPSASGTGRPAPEPARPGALGALLASMPQAPAAGPGTASNATPDARVSTIRGDSAARRTPELDQALMRLDELLRHPAMEASGTGAISSARRLEQYRSALVASAVALLDRQVIELVTRLFESMLADSALPGAFRPVVSRMQVAALRLCLADSTALDSFDHPLWRLLDRIGETSVGHSRIEDPRLAAFLTFGAAVAEEMAGAAAPDAALFRRGLNRIDAFLSEQLQGQLRAAQPAVEALKRAERREVLQQHLSLRLTDSMVNLRTTPAIRRFVTGTWAQVIAADMLRHGEQSEQALATLKTADDLLWSLQIPDHPQSRQRLIGLLPGLLQRLRAGMESVHVPPAERHAVLGELMTIHTEALRPGTRSAGALTPEEIVQRMRDEVVSEAPSARTFSDSVIDLSSMETVPAEHLPAGADRAENDGGKQIESMRVGDRHRIFLQRRWSRVQLLWRSDRSLFFLLSGESPSHPHSITGRALERLASAGLVQPMEARPLVQRAADRMMRDLPGQVAP